MVTTIHFFFLFVGCTNRNTIQK